MINPPVVFLVPDKPLIGWSRAPEAAGVTVAYWRTGGPGDTDRARRAYKRVAFPTHNYGARDGYSYETRYFNAKGVACSTWGNDVSYAVPKPPTPDPPPVPPGPPLNLKVVGLVGEYGVPLLMTDAQGLGVQAMRVEIDRNGMTNKGVTAAEAHARLQAAGIKMLPLINDYTLAWDDQRWEDMARAAIPYCDLGWAEDGNEAFGIWYTKAINTETGKPWKADGRPVGAHQDARGYGEMGQRMHRVLSAAGIGLLLSGITYYTNSSGKSVPWFDDVVIGGPELVAPDVGIAQHPYPNTNPSWDYGTQLALMHKWYPNVPIWLTEIGMKVGPDSQARMPQEQAAFVTKVYEDLNAYDFLKAAFWYSQVDWHTPLKGNDWGFGLIDDLGRPRLSHEAYRAAAASLR